MLLILSVITAVVLLYSLIETIVGLKSIKSLSSFLATKSYDQPKISIIVTAKNEERNIRKTLLNLINQGYPNLEIICVNDRSNDMTGEIINEFVKQNKRVSVIHINTLPENWLGKNYASYRASQVATGNWLLFMDADVNLRQDTLKQAIGYANYHNLDHLTAFPFYHCRGFFHNIVHLVHKGHGYIATFKPWLAKSKRSKRSINSGVFSLIRTDVYHACGGHQAIALNCLDDLTLGQNIKKMGFSQEMVDAKDYIEITWYETLFDMFHGFKKNSFAFFNFKLMPMLFATVAWCLLFIWPTISIFFTVGVCQSINLLNVILLLIFYYRISIFFNIPTYYCLFYPLGLIMFLYPMYSSVCHYYFNKGIYWRGTFYKQSILKNKMQ